MRLDKLHPVDALNDRRLDRNAIMKEDDRITLAVAFRVCKISSKNSQRYIPSRKAISIARPRMIFGSNPSKNDRFAFEIRCRLPLCDNRSQADSRRRPTRPWGDVPATLRGAPPHAVNMDAINRSHASQVASRPISASATNVPFGRSSVSAQ
jgi:hypothetical protein